ncbi:MAG: hypothetical protein HC819_02165 [Cyclobacteriaceae bacterium]|nr:hypothetical protein [Cyclobacteriaceae bacterium]
MWGGKVTGQAGRYNIGFQHIQDQPDDGRSFTVARISRNMGSQSYIGAIGTLGNALSVSDNLLLGLDTRLATAKFKGNKIMAFTGYVMKSHTEGLQGKDLSWGAEINYPNDFFKFRLGHQEIGKNYRAGIGFVPRLGIKENYAEMSLGPRPDKWGILQINVKAEGDFITSYDNSLLTRDIQLTPFQIEMISGDGFKFNTSSQFEFLDKAFDIFERDSISIPAGKYDFWKHKLQFSSARRRRVWVQPEYSWGSFYNGQRQEFEFAFGYKINTPIFIGMEYQHNWISLPAGDFDTEVYRVNANIFFSPDISLTNFIQYDNVSEKMGWQTRFRWIIKPGNEILFVWNSTMYELPEETRFAVQQSSTRLKVNYNIRI